MTMNIVTLLPAPLVSVRSLVFLPQLVDLEKALGNHGIGLGAVNCRDYPYVCDSYNITSNPTVLFVKDDHIEHYTGVCSQEDIVSAVTDKTGMVKKSSD